MLRASGGIYIPHLEKRSTRRHLFREGMLQLTANTAIIHPGSERNRLQSAVCRHPVLVIILLDDRYAECLFIRGTHMASSMRRRVTARIQYYNMKSICMRHC